ncbi:MAG: DNA polymerase III subunit delta', partial [Alphaproteobacteria bacterium]
MTDELPPEPDRAPGTPHPRETVALYGQDAAEAEFLGAEGSGRLHHAWLIEGPRGVGKATLAWRIARHLIAGEGEAGLFAAPASLDMAPDHPVFRRCAALAEPRLMLIRRAADARTGRLRSVIDVEEIRRLRGFLQLSAADGGWRAVIVDAAEEMNASAANALLKFLEEPPQRVIFLLVSHQPARLLPTIRSRCRALRCAPLSAPNLARVLEAAGAVGGDAGASAEALGELAAGSAGEALRILGSDGLALYADLVVLLDSLPRLDRARAVALAGSAGNRGGEDRYALILSLIMRLMARMARAGATGRAAPEAAPGEAALFARLCPDPAAARLWADLAQAIETRADQARAVHLDPAGVILDILLDLERAARRA